jgi:hypothetical protein
MFLISRTTLAPASFLLVILLASPASSVVLVTENGQLIGAHGVIVESQSYNVTFASGTCIDL